MIVARWLHPVAWWLWALGLAAAASRTTNPLLLGLVLAVAAYVVAARRPDAPWARSFTVYLGLGAVVVVLRMLFGVLFGAPMGSTVLLTLPEVALPEWLAGVRIGGDLTLEALLFSFSEGLRLAVVLACVGAANSLASPSRLLKSVPAALYEVGVAVVVALTFAPQLVADVSRVRTARRLRGRPDRGVRGVAGAVMPVLEGALERSVDLAAAMDTRGYGRTAAVPAAARRLTAVLLLGGLVGVCLGVYGALDSSTPSWLAAPAAVVGVVAAAAGLRLSGRRTVRTRYRPDPWAAPEWLVSGSGAVAAAGMVAAVVVAGSAESAGLLLLVSPVTWPALPLLPAAAVLVALLPAWVAPPVPLPPPARRRRRPASGPARPTAGTEPSPARSLTTASRGTT